MKSRLAFDPETTRRTLLRHLAGTATASALPILGQNPPPEGHHSTHPVTKEEATAYHYQFFKPDQLACLDALTETIIPTDQDSPGAKAARVGEYIDRVVADAPVAVKEVWKDGLAVVDRIAVAQYQKRYSQCSVQEQTHVVTLLAGDEDASESFEAKFFAVLKRATVDGYYTSSIGIHQELNYQGNKMLGAFPGCAHGDRHE